ncbi:MFS transporter [Agromyces seonyuensis]|uniref:MFS transporter n=1 Tax=Agromyces seonyuensis TaxID=2662446 RepID=A0A6I4NYE0_9MICO|nr:MFS transporter [Agromyces seonyuensis]MWB97465.1 MFS transporter [Agromyces seonyuensis]
MGAYSTLLKSPGVARIIAAQLVARFPGGMLALAFLIHIEHITGSYGSAGLVLAATSIGQAISGPLTSRLMGRLGMRPVLIVTTAVSALAIVTIGLFDSFALWVYVVLALISGLFYPPIQPAVRTIYPKMVNSRQLTPLFSLDASAQEIIWVVGPVVTTLIATQVSPMAAILAAVVLMVGGGAWFIASPELGRVRIPRSKRKFGVVLGRPPVLLGTIVGFLLIGACSAIEAGVVSVFGEGDARAGLVLGIFSVGSLAGGLLFGTRPISQWAMARRMFIVFFGMALAAFVLDFWWLSVSLFIAGIGIAPVLAVIFATVSSSVKFSDTAEAYGWIGTGQLIGAALGSAFAGFMIDGYGSVGAFWIATGFAFFGFLVPLLGHRWHPDLRGRDASPIPDTEPVPVQPS